MPAPDTIARDLDAMEAAVAGRPYRDGDPLLAELALLVAESRRAPAPDRAATIDRRVHKALAAGRTPRSVRWRQRFAAPALGLAACAVLALVIGLAGISSNRDEVGGEGGGGSMSSDGAGGGATAAPEQATSGRGSAAAGADSGPLLEMDRKVERSATMTVGAPRREVDEVAAGAARVATQLGGFVASSSLSSGSGGSLDLRVPSGRLDTAIDRLSRLGRVRQLERSTLDITGESVSARARVAEWRAERRSLLRQLERAQTFDQTERIRARLQTVNRRLAAARGAARRVDNRARYATLTVGIVGERRAAAGGGGGWSPGDAWHDALRVLEVAAGIALVAFAVALPLVLIGAPAWLATRRFTRRRRERVLDAV